MTRALSLSGLALACWLALASPAQAARWIDEPLPQRTTGQWVLFDARVNGVPMQAQQLTSDMTVDQLVSYYEGRWKRLGTPQLSAQGGKRTLALSLPDVHLALQVQGQGAGSSALLTQAQWKERQLNFMPPELPQLANTQVTQVTETRDGPRRSRLVTLQSQDNLELLRQRLLAHARSRNWRTVADQLQQKEGGRQWLASFELSGQTIDAVLLQPGGTPATQVTLNFLDSPP